MSTSAEAQAITLKKYIEGWGKWTPEDITETWADNVTFTTLPLSCGKPTRERPGFEKRYLLLIGTLKNFQLTVHHVVHDVAQRKAAIYAASTADTDFGPYANEQTHFITFDEKGEKVTSIAEMNDTAFRAEFEPKYYKHIGFAVPPPQALKK
ncbi:hypothetical protein MferCBS31731_000288 [Microsporum ferrugineum]